MIADKKSKDPNTIYRNGSLEVKCNTVTYETLSGDVVTDPFVRVTIYTKQEDKTVIREPILDASKPIRDANGNVVGFGVATDEKGAVYNALNIHKFIVGGTIHMGTLSMPSVSLSGQGISVPTKLLKHIAKRGISKKDAGLDSFFDQEDLQAMVAATPKDSNDGEAREHDNLNHNEVEDHDIGEMPDIGDVEIADDEDILQ